MKLGYSLLTCTLLLAIGGCVGNSTTATVDTTFASAVNVTGTQSIDVVAKRGSDSKQIATNLAQTSSQNVTIDKGTYSISATNPNGGTTLATLNNVNINGVYTFIVHSVGGFTIIPLPINQLTRPEIDVLNADGVANQTYDVYVTPVGQNLAGLTPDIEDLQPGAMIKLSNNVSNGAVVQVRFTTPNTTTVLRTSPTFTAGSNGTFLVTAGRNGVNAVDSFFVN